MHNTTMTSEQRKMLISTLRVSHDINRLAEMTDAELHEQWLIDCEYDNPYKNNP